MIKVACGSDSSCLLTSDGQVYTWGSNLNGELGIDNYKIAY